MIKKTFQINDSSNTRLDTYLSGLLKNESRNKIKSYIKNSSVYVNGESKKPSYLLQNGDKIDISIETEKSIDSNGIIPEKIDFMKQDLEILNKFELNKEIIRKKIDEQNINFYIDFIVNSLFEANKYFNDQEPWKKKDNLIRLNTIVYTTLEMVRKISFLLYPIIPETSLKALKIFNLSEKDIKLETISNNEFIIKGNMINKIDILIKKIEKEND